MKRSELFTKLEDSMNILGRKMYQHQVNMTDSSPAQNHILMIIGSYESIGIKHLSQLLYVTPGAITQHIGALEKSGLVSRSVNPDNRREVNVEATLKGLETIKAIRHTKSKVLSNLFTPLDDQELQTLVSLIDKVSNQYTDRPKEG
jgi:DNA-binding MarR family transcriptional regulator